MCSKEICFQLVSLNLLGGGGQMTEVNLYPSGLPTAVSAGKLLTGGKRGKTLNRRRNGKADGKPSSLRVDPSFFATQQQNKRLKN